MRWKRNLAAVTLALTGTILVGGTSAVTAAQMPWRATATAGAELAALSWQAKPWRAVLTDLPWRAKPWRASVAELPWQAMPWRSVVAEMPWRSSATGMP